MRRAARSRRARRLCDDARGGHDGRQERDRREDGGEIVVPGSARIQQHRARCVRPVVTCALLGSDSRQSTCRRFRTRAPPAAADPGRESIRACSPKNTGHTEARPLAYEPAARRRTGPLCVLVLPHDRRARATRRTLPYDCRFALVRDPIADSSSAESRIGRAVSQSRARFPIARVGRARPTPRGYTSRSPDTPADCRQPSSTTKQVVPSCPGRSRESRAATR